MDGPGIVGSFVLAARLFQRNLNVTTIIALLPYELLASMIKRHISPLFAVDLSSLLPSHDPSSLAPYAEHMQAKPIDFILSIVSLLLIAYFAIMAHSGGKPRITSLLYRARETWLRPVVTVFYAKALFLFSLVAILMFLRVQSLFEIGGAIVFMWGLAVVPLVTVLTLVETWGVLSSLLEEGSHGLKALASGVTFIWRRKVRVFGLMLVMLVVELGVAKGVALLYKTGDWEAKGMVWDFVISGVVGTMVSVSWRLYQWLVYVVFYHSHKKQQKGH